MKKIGYNFLLLLFLSFSLVANAKEITKIDSLLNQLNTNNKGEQTEILNQISNRYSENENYAIAIFYKFKERSIYIKQNQDSLVANCNTKLGVWYYHVGNYNQAMMFLLEALEYFEKRKDRIMIATISINLANVSTRLENYRNAIKYIQSAKKVFSSDKFYNKKSLAGLYTNLGLAYADYNKLDSAIYCYDEALSLIDKNNRLYLASIKNNIGEVLYKKKDFKNAINNYQTAYELFDTINNENGKGASLANIAKVKIALGEYLTAIELSKKAMQSHKKINALYFIVSTQHQIYEAYKGLKQYDKALDALETYLTFNDSLKGSQTKEYVANLEMQYQIKKEQQKLKLLEQEVKLKEKEYRLKQVKLYFTIAVIAFLLLLFILIALYLRISLKKNKLKQLILKQEQEKLASDLNFKQRELESFANYVKEKNQLLEKLKQEVKEEGKKDLPKETLLKNFTTIIDNNLHIDNDRKALELKIDLEHQEFVKRLKEKHDILTKNDIRLCSLILLDLSTKEIASVMNIEANSVKMNKNRLRKKLDLPKGYDLLKYLKTI